MCSLLGVKRTYRVHRVKNVFGMSSWLSGGLSQFSSLTDQISSFTKDVLTETTEEIEGTIRTVNCIVVDARIELYTEN